MLAKGIVETLPVQGYGDMLTGERMEPYTESGNGQGWLG